jgi:hypothetical protein
MTVYTAHDRTQLLGIITPSEPEFAEDAQKVIVPAEEGLIGAFDLGYHRFYLYRQGTHGVWVYVHPWRSANARQSVGAVVDILSPKQHASFGTVTVEGAVVFHPDTDDAVIVEEVAAAFWSDTR